MVSRRRSSRQTPANASQTKKVASEQVADRVNKPRRRLIGWRLLAVALVVLALVAVLATRSMSGHWVDQARASLRIHQFTLAEQQLQRAAHWHRRGGEVALLQCRVAWVQGDRLVSESYLEAAEAEGLDPRRIDLERRLIQIRGGSASAMRPRLPRMLQETTTEDGPAILEAFTAGFLAHGQAEQAAEMLDAWDRAVENDPRILYWRGTLNQAFGQPADAIRDFRAAVKMAPDMTRARLALASVLKSQSFFPEALRQYQQVELLEPDNSDAQLGVGICQLESGELDQGEQRLKSYLMEYPDSDAARMVLAEHYQDRHRSQDVVAVLSPLLNQKSDNLQLLYLFATAYARMGDQAQSDQRFDTFQRLNRLMEVTQLRIKEYEAHPSPALARRIAGDLMRCNWLDAGPWMLKSLAANPRDVEMNLAMAKYLRRLGRDDAAQAYEQNAKSTP